MKINWYPGHMAKAKRLIKEQIKYIDVVYELIDARIPFSSKVDEFKDLYNNKPKILIMTKYDLCDKKETDKWEEYYTKQNYQVIKISSKTNEGINSIVPETYHILKEKIQKRDDKGLKETKIRALIIGIPNVGKSTLINRLTKKNITKTGNIPGITKHNQWIRINDKIDLLDTPGIMKTNINNPEVGLNLAAMTAIKEEILPIDDVAVHILKKMNELYPETLKERYNLKEVDFDDIETLYQTIADRYKIMPIKSEPDYEKISKAIVKDIRENHLGNVTFDRLGA